jgi:hypothetical protein
LTEQLTTDGVEAARELELAEQEPIAARRAKVQARVARSAQADEDEHDTVVLAVGKQRVGLEALGTGDFQLDARRAEELAQQSRQVGIARELTHQHDLGATNRSTGRGFGLYG